MKNGSIPTTWCSDKVFLHGLTEFLPWLLPNLHQKNNKIALLFKFQREFSTILAGVIQPFTRYSATGLIYLVFFGGGEMLILMLVFESIIDWNIHSNEKMNWNDPNSLDSLKLTDTDGRRRIRNWAPPLISSFILNLIFTKRRDEVRRQMLVEVLNEWRRFFAGSLVRRFVD